MPPGADKKHGLALRFSVTIDGQDLGDWARCEGLDVEFKAFEFSELGNSTSRWRMPGIASYSTVTLTRGCTADGSQALLTWLSVIRTKPMPGTADITLHDGWGGTVVSYTLAGVFPLKYHGPVLDADDRKVATEKLVLSHNGFLD